MAAGALLGAAAVGMWVIGVLRDGADSTEASDRPGFILETPCLRRDATAGIGEPIGGGRAAERCGPTSGAGDLDVGTAAPGGVGKQASGRPRTGRATPGSSVAGMDAASTTTTAAGDQGPSGGSTTTTIIGLRERNAPRLSGLRAGGEVPDGQDRIFDDAACGVTSTAVEAVVIDQSRISSVTLYWSFPGAGGQETGSRPMVLSENRATGVLGAFPPGTAPGASSVVIRWWVEAVDANGNVGRADAPDGSEPLSDDERVVLADC